VADALGVAEVDGFADVEAEAFGRDHAGSELAGVERDADVGVDAVEVVEHLHLEVVVAHGDVAVFGHDEVDADDVGVGGGDFEAEEGLGEDLLGWKAAEDLVEEVDGDAAGGGWLAGRSQCSRTLCARLSASANSLHVGGDFIAEAGGEELSRSGELSRV
jgi:hypothetical protein